LTVKSGWEMSFWSIMFCTGVLTGSGDTVLIAGHANPSSPSLPSPEENCALIFSASSTACLGTATPPMVTVSRYTFPEAEEPSP